MTRKRGLPPIRALHELLRYDHETGVFTWKTRPAWGVYDRTGHIAGNKRPTGYVFISVDGYLPVGAHRLAWMYVNGPIPKGMEIDHIDGNPANNAIANLRLATSSQQKMNKRVQSNNRCGLKGAFYHACRKGMKWRSQIRVGEKLIFLGYFHTAEEAHAAYGKAAEEHFGQFARVA